MKRGSKPGKKSGGKANSTKAELAVAAVPTASDWMDAKWQARLDREQKAREQEARRLGMTVAHLDAIQESWLRNSELKQLRAKYDDPDMAGRNCLELLDLVPHGTSSPWPSDELREIVIKAADKLLEVSTSQQRSERARGIANMTLAYLVEVVAKRAFAAIRNSLKAEPNDATQYLVDALVNCCVEFRELVQEGPKRFKPWTRQRIFLPSLRAYTDAFDDDFERTRMDAELARDTGVNLSGKSKPRLQGATLEVAEALQITRWPELTNDGKEWPELTKDTASLLVWWNSRIEPWLLIQRERLLKSSRFTNIVGKTKYKSDDARLKAVLRACKQSLRTLARPRAIK